MIVESHGGSLEVESASGKGTTFYVCLPAAVES
jgi:signal transduction histidine kinase